MSSVPWWRRFYATAVFYPTLAWNYLLGRVLKTRRWWDFVDTNVIVGARPFPRDVSNLNEAGVRAVVNTCEEYAGPIVEYDQFGIDQLHIPTTDFTHPRLEDVRIAVDFIQSYVSENKTVYVHCKAGRARSATVVMCWLIQYRGMTAEQAQQALLKARPHVNPHLYRRPVVTQFVQSLGDDASDHSPAASTAVTVEPHR
ncbi:hypothetical protein V7x_18360 [Crateriforma conspicua]|uniref:Dual specificity phosphatase, catalytic domain n=1 Tax=Crateriforma conspicua TaxID=2527996 RepID=A0A5C6FZ74_9PLAN|nr:dual specificity protein phosphatase family protein [Crateriforma conspicua]TWU66273.1 hypothetical protein V7x_18360 [Crateriforma conspicua]